MTRVAVIGNAGGGKSTLCRALAAARGLPYVAVDQMQWRPGWDLVPDDAFLAMHDAVLDRPTWIIDGFGPWTAIERRFEAADTIVLVDMPFWRHLWWAAKRQIRSIVVGRADGPEGCPMFPVTIALFTMMWRIERDLKPRLLASIARHEGRKTVVRLRSPADIRDFRARYC
jgi:adenylate kinase family enzyme